MLKKIIRILKNLFSTEEEQNTLQKYEEKESRGEPVPFILIQSIQARIQAKRVNLFWVVMALAISILILSRS